MWVISPDVLLVCFHSFVLHLGLRHWGEMKNAHACNFDIMFSPHRCDDDVQIQVCQIAQCLQGWSQGENGTVWSVAQSWNNWMCRHLFMLKIGLYYIPIFKKKIHMNLETTKASMMKTSVLGSQVFLWFCWAPKGSWRGIRVGITVWVKRRAELLFSFLVVLLSSEKNGLPFYYHSRNWQVRYSTTNIINCTSLFFLISLKSPYEF